MSNSSRFRGPQDRLHLARSPAAAGEELAELAGSSYAFVRAAVAGNPNTPPDVLDSLLPSSIDSLNDVEIALAVIGNPATDRKAHERGPLLRRFSADLIAADWDALRVLDDDAGTSNAAGTTLRLGTTELVVDGSGEYAYLIDEQGEMRVALEVLRSWVHNVSAVSPRLRDRIRADFGAGLLGEVLWALGWFPSSKPPLSERLAAAAILFAGGDWHRLTEFVHLARVDFRDALVAGGLQHEDWRDRLDTELA